MTIVTSRADRKRAEARERIMRAVCSGVRDSSGAKGTGVGGEDCFRGGSGSSCWC